MARKDELLKYLGASDPVTVQMVDELIFLEGELAKLKKLPFIKVHPECPERQKPTTAGKLYVSLLAQYNANVRTLCRLNGKVETEEESPLRKWVKEFTRK